MTAPALVLLANGSTDASVIQVIHKLRAMLQGHHDGVHVHAAFLDQCPPSGPQVVASLARQGVEEVVFVPVTLGSIDNEDPRIDAMVASVRANHPGLTVCIAQPIGPEAGLLTLVDAHLRAALAHVHATELDGLVLATEGTSDQRSLSLLARRARQWSLHHKLPVVVASAHGTNCNAAAGVRNLRAQGRRHIAVGSLFLSADEAWSVEAEQAYKAGAIAVSSPLGADDKLAELAWGRYAVAAMGMIDFGFDESALVEDEADAGQHLQVVSA